jgi:hypothetical protein
MWRVDLIHSSDIFARSLTGTAPLPYGWIYGFKLGGVVLPDGYAWMRGAAVGLFVVGILAFFVFLVRIVASGRPHRTRTFLIGAAMATCLALPLLPAFRDLARYFNNYLFEVSITAALVLACALLGTSRLAVVAYVAVLVLVPLFSISTLYLLPGAVLCGAWWAWHSADRRRNVWIVAAATASSALVAGAVFLGLYQPVTDSNPGLTDFWAAEQLGAPGGGVLTLGRTTSMLRDGLFFNEVSTGAGVAGVLVALVAAGGFVVGTVTICRRWPWYGVLIVSGCVGVLAAGVIVDAPVTPVRVNLGVYCLVYLAIVFGCFRALAYVTERVASNRSRSGLVAFGVIVIGALVWLWPAAEPAPAVFARGLAADLGVIARSPTDDNLVLSYHFMSHFYTHDALVNDRPEGKSFTVLREVAGSDWLYDDISTIAERELPDGGMLWCVIPYALGPDESARACQVPPRFELLEEHDGAAARIIAYRVTASDSARAEPVVALVSRR